MHKKLSFAGFLITFAGAVLFSTKAVIVKKAFADTPVDPLTLLTLRMILSLPFFLITALLVRRAPAVPLRPRQWLQVVVLGLFGYYLSSYFDFRGLQYISAGLERLILFLYPSFVVIINRAFFRERIGRQQMVALLLTYAGIGIAYYGELRLDTGGEGFVVGSGLVFLCAVTYAVYIAGSGRVIPGVGATRFTAYAMLSATLGIFVHFALRGEVNTLMLGSDAWLYGLLLAVMATVLPTFLLSAGMLRIGSNNAAIISSIGPVSTILQAHWVLGEPIHAGQLVGTALVIAGVLLTGWKLPRRVQNNFTV